MAGPAWPSVLTRRWGHWWFLGAQGTQLVSANFTVHMGRLRPKPHSATRP